MTNKFNNGKELQIGYTKAHNEQRSGRPSIQTNNTVDQVNQNLQCDRRLTNIGLVMESQMLLKYHFTGLLRKELRYRNLCVRWVTKLLLIEFLDHGTTITADAYC